MGLARQRRCSTAGAAPTGCSPGPGDDTVAGTEGNDFQAGGPGDDTQDGGAGDDVIFANQGRDTTEGGDGNDRLCALSFKDVDGPDDSAGDTVRGGAGDDRIAVRDGERDVVNCGPGIDKAILDFKDVVEDGSCEVVSRDAPNRADSRVEDRNDGSDAELDAQSDSHHAPACRSSRVGTWTAHVHRTGHTSHHHHPPDPRAASQQESAPQAAPQGAG